MEQEDSEKETLRLEVAEFINTCLQIRGEIENINKADTDKVRDWILTILEMNTLVQTESETANFLKHLGNFIEYAKTILDKNKPSRNRSEPLREQWSQNRQTENGHRD